MTNKIKLPCGIDKDGNIVYIKDALKGQDCGCFCPGCKQPLVAKKGDVREQHFAHKSKDFDCEHGFQSALHYMAKDIFMEQDYLIFIKNEKSVRYKIDSIELECKVNEIIPDIIVICDGKRFIVEIYVTHAVDEIKKQKIRDMRISAIEIDLSKYPRDNLNKDTLKQVLQSAENYSWIYDADLDYISEKKEVIEQFGTKRLIDFEAVGCPMLVGKVKNTIGNLGYFVPLEYCVHCTNCYWNGKTNYISCAYSLPLVLNFDTRKKCYTDVFVNDNKVLFASELKEYQKTFQQKLQTAVRIQYSRFINLGRSLYTPSISIGYTQPHKSNKQRSYNHSYYYKKRK